MVTRLLPETIPVEDSGPICYRYSRYISYSVKGPSVLVTNDGNHNNDFIGTKFESYFCKPTYRLW